jgi:uncharacterized protein (DUF58 family)
MQYAKLLAASLAYTVVKQRDSAALRMFDSAWRAELPASSQMGHVTAVCKMLEEAAPAEKTGMGQLLEEFADRVARRGVVFLISDCFDDLDELLRGLRHLRFRGHDVVVFHILHRDEFEFPLDGNIRFQDLEGTEEVVTRPHLLRPAYLRIINAFMKDLERGCDAARVDYVRMPTDRPLTAGLGEYLVRRLQRAKK